MQRRPPGRGRWIVAVAAIALIAASVLQWWQVGGSAGELSQRADIGLHDGRGLVVFLMSAFALLLITLPYAAEGPVAIDRPAAFLILFLVAAGAYVWYAVNLLVQTLIPWPPTRGPGFWLAAIALVLFARGVYEIFDAGQRRY